MPTTARHRHVRDRDRRIFTPRRVRRIEGGTLLLLATVGVILATLRPGVAQSSHLCIVCGSHAAVDAVVNLLLFIPIGAGLALLGLRVRAALAIGAAAAIVIETLQFALPIGRVATIADVITAIGGTTVGFYLSERRRAIAYPRSRAALRHAVGIGIAWLLLLSVSAFALMPVAPPAAYFAQWSPRVEPFDAYTGRILDAHASGVRIPNGPIDRSTELRDAARRSLRIEATVEPRGVPLRLAPIVRVVTADSAEIFMLGQRGTDLHFRSRVRGTGMGLVTPTVVMRDAMSALYAGTPETVVVGARRERGELRVGARGSDVVLSLHAAAGWLLFLPPASSLHEAADIVTAVWAGALLFVAAYWAGRRARRRARRAGDAMRMRGAGGRILATLPFLLGLAVIGLGGISAAFGLSQPPSAAWIGALAGIGAGLVVGVTLALSHDDRPHGSGRHGTTTGEGVRAPEAPEAPGAQEVIARS